MLLKKILTLIMIIIQCFFSFTSPVQEVKTKKLLKLTKWERGIKVESRTDKMGFAYFWFYEWHLFDAIKKGEHTSGRSDWPWQVDMHNQTAMMNHDGFIFEAETTDDGVDLHLKITNHSGHDWPEIAAIIPCFNPGSDRGNTDAVPNPHFFDDEHLSPWFLSNNRLELIQGETFSREIHFNFEFLNSIENWEKETDTNMFVFDHKWPLSDRNAGTGLIIRESLNNGWVTGIAWEDFISVQGHNPWRCMHLSVRVGPLKTGESKTIKGKIYLFKGSKEDCLNRYFKDFRDG